MATFSEKLQKTGKFFWNTFELISVLNLGRDLIKRSTPKQHGQLVFKAIQANRANGHSQANILNYLEMAADRQLPEAKRKHPDKYPFPLTENKMVRLIGDITEDQIQLEQILRLLNEMPEGEFILMMNLLDYDVINQLIKVYGRHVADKIKTTKDRIICEINTIYTMVEKLDEETAQRIRDFRERNIIPMRQDAEKRASNTLRQRLRRRRQQRREQRQARRSQKADNAIRK